MEKERPNVAIVVRCLYDYRLPLYEELRRRGNANIKVFHSNSDLKDHSRTSPDANIKDFAQPIRGHLLKIGRTKFIIQPSIIIRLISGNFDVVICEYGKSIITSQISLLMCKLAKKRFLWWASGWEPIIYPKYHNLFTTYNKIFWRMADGAIVFHTEAYRRLAKAGLPKEKIYIAQNTRDDRPILSKWHYIVREAEILRKRLGIDSSDKVILYTGALIKRKKVDFLIKSFRKIAGEHQNVYLVIVGDGNDRQSLKQLVKELDIPRVIFVGNKTDEVYHYFTMCNIFVLPGLGGLAINDAMICRKPVICSAADGSEKDLVEDGVTGYIIPERILNEDILAERILSVINDEGLNREMGEKSFLKYMKISKFEEMVNNFERAIFGS